MSREPRANGILKDVSHRGLDSVTGSQDAIVVALLPEATNSKLPSSNIFNTLLRQFFVAAQIGHGSEAFDN